MKDNSNWGKKEKSISMDNRPSVSGIYFVNECLIVPVKDGYDENDLKNIGREILNHLEKTPARGVFIDVSAVTILSSYGFSILTNTAKAVSMMGTAAVFVGFQPGVASSLVDFDIDFQDLLTAVTTEDAFALLKDRLPDTNPEDNGLADNDLTDEEFAANDMADSEIKNHERKDE